MAFIFKKLSLLCSASQAVLHRVCARRVFRNPVLTKCHDSIKFDKMIVGLLIVAVSDTEVI